MTEVVQHISLYLNDAMSVYKVMLNCFKNSNMVIGVPLGSVYAA